MSEPTLDEAYWDELLVVPLPSSSSCNKFLQTKTTLVQGVSQRLVVSRPEVSHSFKIVSSF